MLRTFALLVNAGRRRKTLFADRSHTSCHSMIRSVSVSGGKAFHTVDLESPINVPTEAASRSDYGQSWIVPRRCIVPSKEGATPRNRSDVLVHGADEAII